MTKAIVTKTGNSYALRVPKSYIEDNQLKLGDVIDINEPITVQQEALLALVNYGKKQGPLKSISNPVEWQRSQRKSTNPWDEVNRGPSRQ